MLIIIAAAGFVVLVAWAIHSNYTRTQSQGHLDNQAMSGEQPQEVYMREVRQRYQDQLAGVYGWRR